LVIKTTDFGDYLTDLSFDLPKVPVNNIFIDTANSGVMYLGIDFGVYRTNDGGGNWERLNNGMPFVPVLDFDCFNHNGSRFLRAASYGRGVFELDLNHPESVNETPAVTSGLRVWAKPAYDLLWVELPVIASDNLKLSLILANGRGMACQTVYTTGVKGKSSVDLSA